MNNEDISIPKKRGRKPKIRDINISLEQTNTQPIELKKRGRKPSCKILNNSEIYNIKREVTDDCLFIHLPLTKSDLDNLNLLDDDSKEFMVKNKIRYYFNQR
jgi:hypothetical protein